MAQGWEKRELLLPAPTPHEWSRSHAALPATMIAVDGRLELYYSPRDERGRAHIARAYLEPGEDDGSLRVAAHDPDPVLAPGTLGAFDDAGVTMSCIVQREGRAYLYYTGWALGVSVPFYFYVGLAVRSPGMTAFERISNAPILERSATDPYLTASPWVLHDGNRWRMWYVSCVSWTLRQDEPHHHYHLRYAESDDGVHWQRDGRVAIDFASEDEYAISRPCVLRDGDRWRMWFAARGDRYRLGYAESRDGIEWSREDHRAGLEPSREGWDSEMVAYPVVTSSGGRRYMLYNGNGYGRTGIGYAVAASED